MVDMSTLVGSFRRIGLIGPPYEVLGPAPSSDAGQARMRIHLFESNEDVDYPVEEILKDPIEA